MFESATREMVEQLLKALAKQLAGPVVNMLSSQFEAWLEEHLDTLVEQWCMATLPPAAQPLVMLVLRTSRSWLLARLRESAEEYVHAM